ncbi:DUF2179 domain-containing protein [Salidesulfovibrio onnuriiensis]|uniref:DUF2179 domain-containing protein n=1 Tax=Salidesulfovibrio onnuriiensis TaxID=2583823 RepID=UPI0011C7E051|nr:DUF5698 domain-containing protein [Salidesulfovibrio onnuriiensis]
MTMDTIFLGMMVFLAEAVVLTLGTIRVMVSMLGERKMALLLGVVEMLIWVMGTSTVIMKVGEVPFLAVCYALGFGVGTAMGITCEKKLALGNVVLRIISNSSGRKIAKVVREGGYGITTVTGDGEDGPVTVQFVVCKRKDMKHILSLAREVDPELFYTFETAGASSIQRPEQTSLWSRMKSRRPRFAS